MLFLFRRLLALLVSLIVWVGTGLPTQAAYRCTMMDGSRIAAPCCPSEVEHAYEYATISDDCCHKLPTPTIGTPGPSPEHDSRSLAPVSAVISVVTFAPLAPLAVLRHSALYFSGVPPGTAPPRRGITVLQV